MAKKLGKFLLFTAAAGSVAAAAYYYMQKRSASQKASEDEDYDNFTVDDEDAKGTHSYVPLTPDAKDIAEKEDDAEAKAEDASPADETPKQDSGEQDSGFTPLFQQVSQAAETEAETVEEFFNEDTEDEAATEKAE